VVTRIIDNPVADEMSQSFLEYAMSVIVARAIPDVRDGLKPVHRRILYSLHSLGIRPNTPYKKCSRVVGDTMGRYHPHGDQAIYEALVRLAQPWAMALPTVDGHGNFGSLDDGPAASRYTECRMSVAGASMLESLEENTVDFVPNYDGNEREPSVLPSAFPNLLVNGGSGIAVGMASNLPTHNLTEVVAGLSAMLDNPKITLDEMMTLIPGPDFPTGGQVLLLDEVRQAYATGRGAFHIRATARVVDVTARKRGIEVTELPYQIGPEKIIAKIKELVNAKRLNSIADVKDLSDRKIGLRLVIECKTGFNPEAVLAELYKMTDLEVTFGMNAVVLVGGQPATLGLLDMCRHFLDHRRDVVRRRTEFRRDKAEARRHIIEGLLIALSAIDEVVAILRSSKDTDTARKKLIKAFSLSEIQTNHILEMPLRRLTSLETTKLKDELRDITATLRDLERILKSAKALTDLIKSELVNAADTYGVVRRSRLSDEVPVVVAEMTVQDEPCTIAITPTHIGRVLPLAPRTKQGPADLFTALLTTTTHATLGLVTSTGRLHKIEAMTLVEAGPKSSGAAIAEYVALDKGERPVGLVTLPLLAPLAMVTAQGVLKRLDPKTVPTRFPSEIITIDEGDWVVGAFLAPDDASLVMISATAQLLRTPAAKIRPQGRAAGGVKGMALEDDAIVAFARAHEGDVLVLATDVGAVKVTPIMDYPEKGRGTGGVRCAKLRANEHAVTQAVVAPLSDVLAVSNKAALELPESSRRDAATTPLEGLIALGLARPRPTA
jgi:DNA gyrase subunit A